MAQPIQRDGVWWHQKADGNWLRWNAQKSEWETAPAAPPPPAPPQENAPLPAVLPDSGADRKGEPAFGFSTADGETSPTPALPEGTEEVAWELGESEAVNIGPANADVLPPETDQQSATDWLNSNRPVALLAALVVLAAAVFSAFTFMGGNDDPGPGATPGTVTPLPKKAAVRKLNSLCSTAQRRMNKLGTPTTPDEFVSYMDKAKSEYQGILRQLRGVKTSPQDKAAFNRIVKDIKQTLRYTDRIVAAAQAGDDAAFQQMLLEMDSFSTKMKGHARAFGAHACADA